NMAHLVAAFGTSHSIMLNATLEDWLTNFRVRDLGLPYYDREGRQRRYEEAVALAPPDAGALIAPERITERFTQAQDNIARMKREIAAARLDALVIIGDDQRELFQEQHQPSVAIYYGDSIRNAAALPIAAGDWQGHVRMGFREPA